MAAVRIIRLLRLLRIVRNIRGIRMFRELWMIFQIITLDSWATDIVRPMSEVSPWMTWVMLFVITVCTFGVLNVIIAVMVERTLTIAKENRDIIGGVLEKTEKELLKSMAEDFFALDEDGSGELDFEEFQKLIRTPTFSFKLRLLGIFEDEAESLFELMDQDDSGTVSPEEFIAGLQKLKGPAKGQDLVQLIGFAQRQCARASRFCERISKLNIKADEIQ